MSKILSLAGNDKGIALIVVESILLSLDILCVGLRLWARRIRNKSLELNDYTIIVALVLMIARCINELLVVLIGGLGLHLTDVIAQGGLPAVVAFGKMAFVDDMLWLTLVGLIKVSILDLYRSLFANPLFQKINRAVMFLTILVAFAFLLTQVLICQPVAFNWDTTLNGKCGDTTKKYTAVVVVDLIIDVIIIVLPMPVLWGLQMPIEKRFALIFVFGIGFFICAVTGVRLKWVLELDYSDPTYSLAEFGIFAALEPLLGIINACLPVIPLVFKEMIKKPGFMSNWKSTGRSTTLNTGLSASRPTHHTNESSQQFVRLEDSDYQLTDMSKKKGAAITITNEWTVKADQKSLHESTKHYR